jgi:hypothetical protein
MKLKPIAFYWILAFLLPIFPIYQALMFPIEEHAYDAAEFHIFRAVVYATARADGWLYPRWVQFLNGGLGGPFFSLYPSLSYALMDVLHILGFSFPLAWRVLVALAFLAASVGMFGLGLTLTRRADVALVCATIFGYSGLLFRDFFERGAPSGMAVTLFPLMLWLLIRFVENPSGLRLFLASLCLAAITLLHSQTAFLLIPLAGVVILFLFVRGGIKLSAWALVPLVTGVLLAMFYMLPFVFEVKQVQFDNATQVAYTNPITNPLRLEDLFALPRKLDMGISNNMYGESPDGLVFALALLAGIPLTLKLWSEKRNANAILIGGLSALGFLVIWMQLDVATPIWSAIPSLSVFLFRWKLLSILSVCAALISGYAFQQIAERLRPIVIGGFILAFVILQLRLAYPQLLFHYIDFAPSPSFADIHQATLKSRAFGLSSFDEFMPATRSIPITDEELDRIAGSPIENLPTGARIQQAKQRTASLELTIASPVAFVAALHTLYFPGWAGYIDGRAQTLGVEEATGYILMNVPAGVHTIVLNYEGTLLQHIGDALSISTLFAVLILAIIWRGKKPIAANEPSTPQPKWGILLLVPLALILKATWVDPQTTLLRSASTCAAIDDQVIRTDVLFGDGIHLCGFTLNRTDARPGDFMTVTLYWQLDRPTDEPAHAYVHLLGQTFNPETGTPLWGELDKENPGPYPLPELRVGALFRDRYDFRVAPNAPPGSYQLEIGWWQSSNGQRLNPMIVRPMSALSVSALDSLLYSEIILK